MIALVTTFWIMVALFGLVGMMRGWTREVIVSAAVILALFTINQFASTLFGFLGFDNNVVPPPEVRRQEFYIMSAILVVIAFFGYQGPTLASSRLNDRLRIRDNLQDKVLGFIAGCVNGYLVMGSIWSFLEYRVVSGSEWVRYSPEVPYPFDPTVITRPAPELAGIIEYLPIPLLTSSPYILPLMLVVVFLFVLVVLL